MVKSPEGEGVQRKGLVGLAGMRICRIFLAQRGMEEGMDEGSFPVMEEGFMRSEMVKGGWKFGLFGFGRGLKEGKVGIQGVVQIGWGKELLAMR